MHDSTSLPLTQPGVPVRPSFGYVDPLNTNVQIPGGVDPIGETDSGKLIPQHEAANAEIMLAMIELTKNPITPDGKIYISTLANYTGKSHPSINIICRRIVNSKKPLLGYYLVRTETGKQCPAVYFELKDAKED